MTSAFEAASCAHVRVTPTKEIRGEATWRVFGEHWRCEDCNLEFRPMTLEARQPIKHGPLDPALQEPDAREGAE